MKPRSRYVIGELGFQPRCSPVFSSNTTAFQALTYRTGWGWGSLSHGKLWSDMADILTYGVILGKEVCSFLCCPCTWILQPMISYAVFCLKKKRQYEP